MAHFVRLNQLDHGHTSDDDEYTPLLINLDMVINIEPSPNIGESIIITKNNNFYVKETQEEILRLSRSHFK